MEFVRQQTLRLEALHAQHQQVKLETWIARKPEVKQYIEALSQQKELLNDDIRQTEDRLNSFQPTNAVLPKPSTAARPGSTSLFANMSDDELVSEQARMRKALIHISGQVLAAKAVFAQPTKADERDLWEAQLLILQVVAAVGLNTNCSCDFALIAPYGLCHRTHTGCIKKRST